MGDPHRDGPRADGQDPVHHVRLDGFGIDTTVVTDDRRFVHVGCHDAQVVC
jgi:hypothetical protein